MGEQELKGAFTEPDVKISFWAGESGQSRRLMELAARKQEDAARALALGNDYRARMVSYDHGVTDFRAILQNSTAPSAYGMRNLHGVRFPIIRSQGRKPVRWVRYAVLALTVATLLGVWING